ncbi:MAG: hypothetical protein IPG67_17025 [Acidobacteria bacterium]|nr:hypothetical protein [Acidobacteriota bacterium]
MTWTENWRVLSDIDSIATIREEIGQVKKMLEESRIKLAALNLEEKRLASKKDELQGKWIRHLQTNLESTLEGEDALRILGHSTKFGR